MQTLKDPRPLRSGRLRPPRYHNFLPALALALVTLLGLATYQTPLAHAQSAGSSGPIIHWDQSMIYPGQNNGYPEGPIGETAVIHGQNFTAGVALDLVIVAGDSNTNPALCQLPGTAGAVKVATATTDQSGGFTASFAWPAGVGQTGQTRTNSICSYTSGTPATLTSSHDDGPFTVLTDHKPAFSLSTTSVAAGSTITISGQNWVPPQPINITIASCADCDPGNGAVIAGGTTTSNGLTSGTFSLKVSIPANMPANTYVVNVTTQNGPLDAYHIDGLGVKQLAVTAAVVTPTPTAGPSPSVTADASPTAATTPTTTTTPATNTNNGNGGNSLVITILIVLAIALLAIGGIIFFLLAQRKKRAGDENTSSGNGLPTTPPGPSGAHQANQFNAPRTSMTPFPQGQPMNTPGNFGQTTNTHSGYNQSNNWQGGNQPNQPWSGNPQSTPQNNWQNNAQGNWPGNPQSNAGLNNFQQNQPFQPQQGNYMPNQGMGQPTMNRQCLRCASPLPPNSLICGVCGTRNPASNPNDPTIAY